MDYLLLILLNRIKKKKSQKKGLIILTVETDKMQEVINDIDEAIKSVKKYSDFKLALKAKGYSNIKDNGKYFSAKNTLLFKKC